MANRMISSVRKADMILKSGVFTGNLNILAKVQPKRLELGQFFSELSANPPRGFGKPFGPKAGNNSASFKAGGIGADRKLSSFAGDRDGRGGDDEKSNDGPSSRYKNKRKILVAISTAGILGVCWWVYFKRSKEFNWKGIVDNFLGQ